MNSLHAIDYPQLRDLLRRQLSNADLLGERQRLRSKFSPSLSYGRHFGPPLPSARPAAVMILVEPRDGQWTIPLTVRHRNLQDHPGQISLPGGRLEHDETHLQAAVREFAEELGVEPFPGDFCGELQPIFIYNSNYHVRPFVAICNRPLDYEPCPQEVDRLIHLPLTALTDSELRELSTFSHGRASWDSWAIRQGQDRIWGATAIVLGELAALLDASESGSV